MSIRILIFNLIIGLLIFVYLTYDVQAASIYENAAAARNWLKKNNVYRSDSETGRWIWSGYEQSQYKVDDCNKYCRKYFKSDGQCEETSNDDFNSWCPQGQTCVCQ